MKHFAHRPFILLLCLALSAAAWAANATDGTSDFRAADLPAKETFGKRCPAFAKTTALVLENDRSRFGKRPQSFQISAAENSVAESPNPIAAPAVSAAVPEISAPAQPRKKKQAEVWPDGSPIDAWFADTAATSLEGMGQRYVLTDYGVVDDSTLVQTDVIQAVIDIAATRGDVMGGRKDGEAVVVVPRGTFLTGALFLRQGVNLWIEEGGRLKGSDDISDFPVVETRIEGQTCKYFAALINGDGLDGVKIGGRGTIDGNGLRYWRAFWLRRSWNPACTNKDEQRPRLIYLSHCTNAEISGLHLKDSPFWTNHLYKCSRVRMLGLRITSPAQPVKAPSTDAIDIDACTDIHVAHCFMEVNDDAVALKGGKGVDADQRPENGSNERILVEDCRYGFCHGCLTLGSEAVHCKNIILRRIHVDHGARLLWLKMRPDTPQHYEYVLVEDIEGSVTNFLFIKPWTQFFDLQGRTEIPISVADHITMRRCKMRCQHAKNVEESDQYVLRDFSLEQLRLTTEDGADWKMTDESGNVFGK